MSGIVIASFYVYRPIYAHTGMYIDALKILDRSCKRAGFDHIVLTDSETSPRLDASGLRYFCCELPQSLMKATTESQARWLESAHSRGVDTCFVGADCIVRRDFRAEVPPCDLAIAYMKGHRKWRLNNGFMYVRASSRDKVAPVFRLIADDTHERMCDDMLAIERALQPMPPDYGEYERRGLAVNFLPLPKWNRYMAVTKETPDPVGDKAEDAAVLHFMGGWHVNKVLLFRWARRHGFA